MKLKKTLSLLLTAALMVGLLSTTAMAADEELLPTMEASTACGSVGEEDGLVVAAPELDMPELQPALDRPRTGSRPVTFETVNTLDFFYLNGNSAVIKEDTDGETYIYDETGNTKLIERAATNDVVYGGSLNIAEESGDTHVVMESGTLFAIYGGDVYSNRTGDTCVEVKGGTLTNLYGGSDGYGNQNYGQLTGNVHVVFSGTAAFVIGGGDTAGSSVSGTVIIELKDGANVTTQLVGGSSEGTVGDVSITVENGAIGKNLCGGGIAETSKAGNISINFGGTFSYVYGGAGNGTTKDVAISFNEGGRISGVLFGGGNAAGAITKNVSMRLNGGCAYQNEVDYEGYIYGGGSNGTVTGDVSIHIDAENKTGWHYIRGGGQNSDAVVEGNVSIFVNSAHNSDLTCGGFDGPVQGNATLTVTTGKEGKTNLSYMNGSGTNAAVAGARTLVLENTSNAVFGWIGNFGKTELRNAELSFRNSLAEVTLADLSMDSSSVLALAKKSLSVEGNFSGGGTLAITAGNTFSVAGATTGQTTLRLLPQDGTPLPAQILLVSGRNAAMEHYTLAEPTDMALVKKTDGLYAMTSGSIDLSAALSGTKIYGNSTSVTITAEAGQGLTTNADVTISIKKDTSSEVVYTNTVKLGSDNRAVFSELPLLTAGNYSLTVSLVENAQSGSTTTSFTISKRTLTMQTGSYAAFSRPYLPDYKEVAIPGSHFKDATLIGYYGSDHGAVINLNAIKYYNVTTPDAGNHKENTPKDRYITLRSDVGNNEDEKRNAFFIYNNYQLESPAMTIHITPIAVTTVRFPGVQAAVTVGDPISKCVLTLPVESPGSFAWETPNTPVTLGTQNYNMVYTPADTQNYDYSAVQGWNAATKKITQPIAVRGAQKEPVTLNPHTPTYTVSGAAQHQEIVLSNVFSMPGDAGALQMTYNAAASQLGQLTGVAVVDGKLQFTIPADATPGEAKIAITISSVLYRDTLATVNVSLTSKKAVAISGISIAGVNSEGRLVYSGEGAAYAGTPVITGGYTGTLEYIWSMNGNVLEQAPSNVGTYTLTVRVPGSDLTYAGKLELEVPIIRAPLSVRANDQTITAGSDVPTYTVAVSGLKGTDTATATAQCSYQKGSPIGTYPIIPNAASFTVGKSGNYLITPENGTLTVIPRASNNTGGGGGTTSSKTETVTNPDGSVTKTETTTSEDPRTGATVETKKESTTAVDGTVTQKETITISGGRDGVSGTVLTTTGATGETSVTITLASRDGASAITLPAAVTGAAKGEHITAGISVGGLTLEMDTEAVEAILKVGGKTPVISADSVADEKLPEALRGQAAGYTFTVNGKGVDFDGGTVMVSIPYTMKDASKVIGVFYVGADGTMKRIPSVKFENGVVSFVQPHWSIYAILEEAALPFTDVEEGVWYYDAVRFALEQNITKGTGATTFSPDMRCTRAQTVTFLWNAMGKPAPTITENPFTDVETGSYYYDAALWAVEKGITVGTGATSFSPDQTITRAQFVTFLHRAAGKPAATASNPFTDVTDKDAYYYDAVLWAVEAGITNGTTATTFSPEAICTRAQVVTFLYHLG